MFIRQLNQRKSRHSFHYIFSLSIFNSVILPTFIGFLSLPIVMSTLALGRCGLLATCAATRPFNGRNSPLLLKNFHLQATPLPTIAPCRPLKTTSTPPKAMAGTRCSGSWAGNKGAVRRPIESAASEASAVETESSLPLQQKKKKISAAVERTKKIYGSTRAVKQVV